MINAPVSLTVSFPVRLLQLSSRGCSTWTGDHLGTTQAVGIWHLKQRFTRKVRNSSEGTRIDPLPVLAHCIALDGPGHKSYVCIF